MAQFARVAQYFGSHVQLLSAIELRGGVSARVTLLEMGGLADSGESRRLLVRQHGPVDLAHNPHIASAEFRLLQWLYRRGLPVPEPYFYDEAGQWLDAPGLVVAYLAGETRFAPALGLEQMPRLAALLARIHRLDLPSGDLTFLPEQRDRWRTRLAPPARPLDTSLDEGLIREVLKRIWPPPTRNPVALLHGDFWPGNVLWQGDEISGVIDWEDASLGDPLEDLASSRQELLWACGREAMRSFTYVYRQLQPLDYSQLPYWDLLAALRPAGQLASWAADAATEERMRAGHRFFRTQALAALQEHSESLPAWYV